MKIKEIGSILKTSKTLNIHRYGNKGQWLGDGRALYLIHNLPDMTDKHIFAMFDIPEKEHSKYSVNQRGMPTEIDVRDHVDGEKHVARGKFTLNAFGCELEPLNTSEGTIFINTKYIKPLSDEKDGVELYERKGKRGTYIVAKSGMLLVGVIMPFYINGEKFLCELEELVEGCRRSLENTKPSDTQLSMEDA